MPTVSALYRYPVKGLSAEPLTHVTLAPAETFPFDRAYAIENGSSKFDPAALTTLPKIAYLMLMRNARLAQLSTEFDETSAELTVRRGDDIVVAASLDTDEGRRTIEAFFDDFAADELRGPTHVVHAPGFSFSDHSKKVVSLINMKTVDAISREFGQTLHPLRFRGNLYVEGLAPWAEFDFVGKRIEIGGVVLEGTKRIDRCAATNVNPETAERDATIPVSLLRTYGHADCGVYLRVVEGGSIAIGDTLKA